MMKTPWAFGLAVVLLAGCAVGVPSAAPSNDASAGGGDSAGNDSATGATSAAGTTGSGGSKTSTSTTSGAGTAPGAAGLQYEGSIVFTRSAP